MSAKTIFIIVVTILITIILMKNTDEVKFWLFGDAYISKLAILGVFFGLGIIVGFLLGRPRSKTKVELTDYDDDDGSPNPPVEITNRKQLSDEDRDYIN